jgi:hypothetical protein
MKRLSVLIERLRGGRRPPAGPLTAAEQTAAEQTAAEDGRESHVKDDEGAQHEQGEKLTP